MAADWSMKSNDRLPSIQATLSADLTTATGVDFVMLPAASDWTPAPGGVVKVNAAAVIEDASAGLVRYDWLAVDTADPGQYLAEWEVTWTGGKKQTFPTTTYHTIEILADLDGA